MQLRTLPPVSRRTRVSGVLTRLIERDYPIPMSRTSHVPSWYAETAVPSPDWPALAGDASCDVCVVGGGYTGLTAALEFAERGFNVVLLEAERVGWGASGRNGGQLITGFSISMRAIERLVGRDGARAMWAIGQEATDQVRDRVERHAIDCDLAWGYVHAAIKPRHERDADALLAEALAYGGTTLSRLDAAAIRTHVGTGFYRGGLLDTGSGHLHPLNFAIGLARAAADAGVRIHEGTRAVSFETGASPVVRTGAGSVRCRFVVLAGNAYIGDLSPRLDGWIMPAGTYIIATEPLGEERARRLLPTNAAVSDMNFVLNYFRRSHDHRLLFGGGVSYSGFEDPRLKTQLRAEMLKVFPELAGAAIDKLWGGHVAITMNRLPQIGRLSPTVWFAHGYSGHGVALAGMAGRLIAEAVSGTAGRFDVLARIPHRRFPGGRWLRTPALVLAMLWFRLLDLL